MTETHTARLTNSEARRFWSWAAVSIAFAVPAVASAQDAVPAVNPDPAAIMQGLDPLPSQSTDQAPENTTKLIRSNVDPSQAAANLESMSIEDRISAARRMYEDWLIVNQSRGVTRSMRSSQVRALLRGMNIEKLTAGQVERLARLFSNDPELLMLRAQAHAQRLADDDTATGAVAQAALAAMDMYQSGYPKPSRVNKLLQHPGLFDALRNEQATETFQMINQLQGWGLHPSKDIIFSLHTLIDESMSPETILYWTGVYPAVNRLSLASDADKREEIRQTLQSALEGTLATIEDRTDDQRLIERVRLREREFAGYWGHKYLEGLEAPSLQFQHRPRRFRYENLADLRGKVVIMDFFTTWASPSIKALPKLRELASRYRGYDVEIVGLTSLQGWHAQEGARIETRDDPELEYSLMVEFARDNRIEWPVVFSSLPVIDQAYGVEVFPHVTIIDPKGIVRFNQLNLNNADMNSVMRAIDGILEDNGMRRPSSPIG